MKTCVIGPSGGGKTYLATKLSEKLGISHINLDYVFYKHVVAKKREAIPEVEWKANLATIISQSSWIIEGVNPIKEVFDAADSIVYLRPSVIFALYRQWKRYFTDPKQRREHGFKNNLLLSKYLIMQYIEEPDATKMDDPKYSRVKKLDKVLQGYGDKVIVLKTKSDVASYLASMH